MQKSLFVAAALLIAVPAVFAQSGATPAPNAAQRIEQRQANQERRIEQGEKSGSLTQREANRLERRQARVEKMEQKAAADGTITRAIAEKALTMLDVDPLGFDLMDRKLLEAVVHRFDGGPVGLDNVAAAIGEEPGTIEDVIEPYLIQQGFLQRTPRGRIATLAAYRHLGVAPPKQAGQLFDE